MKRKFRYFGSFHVDVIVTTPDEVSDEKLSELADAAYGIASDGVNGLVELEIEGRDVIELDDEPKGSAESVFGGIDWKQ